MNKNKIAITLGTVCLLLTIAIVVQINTIKGTSSTVSKNFSEDNLRDEVLRWKERYDEETIALDNAEKTLSKIREESTKNDTTASSKEEEITRNNNLLGITDVEGKGIEITVKDNQNISTENIGLLDISAYIVHDNDLRRIVNELKNAGAEAISINGQRIVSTTAITCIGNVVKINDEKVTSPFVIKAIGFPERFETLSRSGGILDELDDYIEISTRKLDNIKIPKYTGVIPSKYMK